MTPPRVHDPNLMALMDQERSMESVRQSLADQKLRLKMGQDHKDQLNQLLGQIDHYYDSYQKLYQPVLESEIRQHGGFL